MDQLCAEVGALKHVVKLQADVCGQVMTNTVEVDQRVIVLECRSEVTAEPVTLNAQGSGTASHFPLGKHAEERWGSRRKGGPRGRQEARALAASRTGTSTVSAFCPEMLLCGQDRAPTTASGRNMETTATTEDPVETVLSTCSPQWSKVVKNGKPRHKLEKVNSGSGMHAATTGHNKRPGPVSIIGTGAVSTIRTVKTKLVSVFATKFALDVDAETLALYLREKLKRDVTCQKIASKRSRFGSFKVTAECNDVGEMYNPELWPEGALVRRYYEPRKPGTVVPNSVDPAGAITAPSGTNVST